MTDCHWSGMLLFVWILFNDLNNEIEANEGWERRKMREGEEWVREKNMREERERSIEKSRKKKEEKDSHLNAREDAVQWIKQVELWLSLSSILSLLLLSPTYIYSPTLIAFILSHVCNFTLLLLSSSSENQLLLYINNDSEVVVMRVMVGRCRKVFFKERNHSNNAHFTFSPSHFFSSPLFLTLPFFLP